MKLMDSITVYHNSQPRYIELYHGDLTELSEEDAADMLVVSAFPGMYAPSTGTLIGALNKKNVSVGRLALDKEVDLRESFSCWISKEISQERCSVNFKRILCFEPRKNRTQIAEVIGDIFQSLIAFLSDSTQERNVAMPLVSTGKRRAPVSSVLPSLIEAAAHWLSLGLPVKHLKIAAYSPQDIAEVEKIFPSLKAKYDQFTQPKTASDTSEHEYDIFISYCHENAQQANQIVSFLKKLDDGLSIFIDKRELNVGCAWQQQIYDALDSCRKIIAIYSDDYLNSKVCKEEFNIALYRDRDTEENILFPIYLYTTALPTYMKVVQYIDCREADQGKLEEACAEIIAELKGSKLRQVRKQITYKDEQKRTNNEIIALLKKLQTQVDQTSERLSKLEQQMADITRDKN
ncbi:TIR domain-containing protein [Candidatus Uabimicrobium sp. HlEnr_7]|uniref:toll/interleukin-1 receptor domain-containing protein n=1 Tax=Candidatus Uabimicrobium helgolandensis TaxID=3095367 RepID=UPI003555E7A2